MTCDWNLILWVLLSVSPKHSSVISGNDREWILGMRLIEESFLIILCEISQVYVLPPRKMEFLPSVVEAQVGYSLSLPLAVATCIYTGKGKALCYCHYHHLSLLLHLLHRLRDIVIVQSLKL